MRCPAWRIWRWRISGFLAIVVFLCELPLPAGEGIFEPAHVAKLRSVASARISPDGRFVAYGIWVPRTPFKDENGPAWEELHVVDREGNSRPYVTGAVNVSGIAWTPDGRGISFLIKRGKDKHKSLYRIPIDGGEARRILSHETDIGEYSFSPDGRRVAFLAKEKEPQEKKDLEDKGFDAEIFEETWKPVRVWVAGLGDEAAESRALDLPGSASELHWSPAGSHLALALAPTPLVDDSYMMRRVRVVDADTGQIISSIENPGKLGQIAWSPDGKQLAIIAGEDEHDPSEGRLMVVPASGGPLVNLTPEYEGEIISIQWKDPETILYLGDQGVWTVFGEVRRDGTERKILVPDKTAVMSGLSFSLKSQTCAILLESPRHPPEVILLPLEEVKPERLTSSNPGLEEMRFAAQEPVSYRARDGLELEGILIHPLQEKPGRRYPLILMVHGGPEAHERNGWLTSYGRPGQVAAARGFAVFYPNYRGSTARGVAFSKMGQADYGGKEYDDLVDAVDHLIEIGLVDRDRVGITGGSWGGYATAWCSTRYSERFAASVMFVGLSDLISKFGTTDIPNEWYLVHSRKWLWDDWLDFLKRSPIYHVQKARTPILILHGKEDTRVHPSQSLELYRNLKILGQAPARLVFYPGEGHGNRKAAARLDYNLRMLRWFEHYLKGPGGNPPPHELDYDQALEPGKEKSE